jgi:hypothetical protein
MGAEQRTGKENLKLIVQVRLPVTRRVNKIAVFGQIQKLLLNITCPPSWRVEGTRLPDLRGILPPLSQAKEGRSGCLRVLEVVDGVQDGRPSTPPGIGEAACLDLLLVWEMVTG